MQGNWKRVSLQSSSFERAFPGSAPQARCALPLPAGDPGPLFLPRYLNVVPPGKAPAPNAAHKNCDSRLNSFPLNLGRGESVGAAGWGRSSRFSPGQTRPRSASPRWRVSGLRLAVYLKFHQQLSTAEQECNRKIHQCLMASESRGGHNYVVSTC